MVDRTARECVDVVFVANLSDELVRRTVQNISHIPGVVAVYSSDDSVYRVCLAKGSSLEQVRLVRDIISNTYEPLYYIKSLTIAAV